MRAKRSKKYRKTMSAYQQAFNFRPPYQVLLDTNFLRACHAFHMPIQKFLENTLHDVCKPYITQCTLAKINAYWEKQKEKNGDKRKGGRPEWCPPPTEMPLRYCKHRDAEGVERGPLAEGECLVDLLSGQAKGNEVVRNKQHYVLGTAEQGVGEAEAKGSGRGTGKGRGELELRERARAIPGVPIVYVKRSVMVLEELSGASEAVRRGDEKQKFKEGLGLANVRKRKRGQEDDDDNGDMEVEDEVLRELLKEEDVQRPTARGFGRAKGPNPLSVKKKHKVQVANAAGEDGLEESKKKSTRRIRGKKKKATDDGEAAAVGADVEAGGSD